MPNADDVTIVKQNLVHLISRTLTSLLLVPKHIFNKYSSNITEIRSVHKVAERLELFWHCLYASITGGMEDLSSKL